MRFGWVEILLIVLVVLLLFGGRKIPEMMRGMGRGVKEFKEGVKDAESENKDSSKQEKTP